MKSSVPIEDNLEDINEEPWADAYRELMGDEDEVDVFFILPRTGQEIPEAVADEEASLMILRVTGLPDDAHAWVH